MPSHNNVESRKLKLISEKSWQEILSASAMSVAELLQRTSNTELATPEVDTDVTFPVRVPEPYLQKIRRGDPDDPLLLQVLPQSAEKVPIEGYTLEPLNEQDYSPIPGLIHKYRSRVLLVSTQVCAIHCRYCFRRNFPYSEHQRSRDEWQSILRYIEDMPDVNEVILSGGDPLSLSDRYLDTWLPKIAQLPQVKRLRIHTRMLPSLPQRVTKTLCSMLAALSCDVILVAHCNHPNELAADTQQAFMALKRVGVTLLNQSVLLKQVNDNADVLKELSEKLFAQGVMPYYLFLMDKVHGAAHFDTEITNAQELYQQLASALPGYLIPKLAKEEPGLSSKTLIGFS